MLVKSNSQCSTQISRIKGFRLLGIISFRLSFLGAFGCARWWDGCVGDGAGRRSCPEDTGVLLAPAAPPAPRLLCGAIGQGPARKEMRVIHYPWQPLFLFSRWAHRLWYWHKAESDQFFQKSPTFLSPGCCGRGCSVLLASRMQRKKKDLKYRKGTE